MHPDLFSIGPLTLHTYGLMLAIGFITALIIAVKMGKKQGISSQQITDISILLIISGIVGSRIVYVLMNISDYVANPLSIFKTWEGGLVFSGGLIFAIVVIYFYFRHHKLNMLQMGDIFSPSIAIGQAIGRIGCFMAGCCYGKPTSAPWGVMFTNPKSIAPLYKYLHPTQLYDSFSNFLIFTIIMILSARKKYNGQVFLWFLIMHSIARLVIERFRGDDRGMFLGTGWTTTQFLAILILLSAIGALFYLKSKHGKKAYH